MQVNGKLRAKIDVTPGLSNELMETIAKEHENVQRFTKGLSIKKIVVVPNKLVNIVVG